MFSSFRMLLKTSGGGGGSPPPSASDPDADAYISAVYAAGVDDAQLSAMGLLPWSTLVPVVDDFYIDSKADSYYTNLKRAYLPIWGIAAANAIDMVTLGSGTFNGGLTHGAGFIQGNGSTGYFNSGVSPSTVGIGGTSLAFGLLHDITLTGSYKSLYGADNGSPATHLLSNNSFSVFDAVDQGSSRIITSAIQGRGILIANFDGTTQALFKRVTAGFTTADSAARSTGTGTTSNMYFLARNANGTMADPSDFKLGMYGFGLGLGHASGKPEALSLAMKTLWETATGLTLA